MTCLSHRPLKGRFVGNLSPCITHIHHAFQSSSTPIHRHIRLDRLLYKYTKYVSSCFCASKAVVINTKKTRTRTSVEKGSDAKGGERTGKQTGLLPKIKHKRRGMQYNRHKKENKKRQSEPHPRRVHPSLLALALTTCYKHLPLRLVHSLFRLDKLAVLVIVRPVVRKLVAILADRE